MRSISLKVLVADDDAVVATLLGELLTGWGHDVEIVHDGESAWEAIAAGDFRCLVSDWEMPRLDGPALCRRLRREDLPHYVYTILVTSHTTDEDLVEGLAAGADDFVRKAPFNPHELEARLRTGLRILELQNELASRNQALESAVTTMRSDLVAAAEVQRGLLPDDARAAGIDFASLFCPSAHVSGDVFNALALPDGRCGFYLADVAGHGVPASLTAVSLSNLLTREFLGGIRENADMFTSARSADDVVSELNVRFLDGTERNGYFTMVYGTIDPRTRTLEFCQAGHPPLVRVSRSGKVERIGDGGFPVGLLPDSTFESQTVALSRGDRLFAYSDGITECANAHGEQFGEQRLVEFLDRASRSSIAEALTDLEMVLRGWSAGPELEDDVSVLALAVPE